MPHAYARPIWTGILLSSLIGCASMPKATLQYYLPQSTAKITVTQTARCLDTKKPIVETTVDFATNYSADLNKPKTIDFAELDTFYSSGSADITLTGDGRLEAFNSSSTGNMSDVIPVLVSLIGTLQATAAVEFTDKVEAACQRINKAAGEKDGKPLPLSITLTANVAFLPDRKTKISPFQISGYPQSFYDDIVAVFGLLTIDVTTDTPLPAVPITTKSGEKRLLASLEPAVVPVKVIHASQVTTQINEYKGAVLVPQWGSPYTVPIPTPPLFGTNTLNLTLFDSGKIKTLKYGTTNGAKDLGSAINAISDKLITTDAEKAAALKNEADVIAQQQRLVKCKSDPAECK